MKLPIVYPLTRPRSHSTNRITAIVNSIVMPLLVQILEHEACRTSRRSEGPLSPGWLPFVWHELLTCASVRSRYVLHPVAHGAAEPRFLEACDPLGGLRLSTDRGW